jgi:transposase-like protein
LIGPERRCPRCKACGAVKRGTNDGLTRYRCKGCGRSFNALTGTPLSKLKLRGRWILFAQSAMRGETLKVAAANCDVHIETVHRWRHRFLGLSARKARERKLGNTVQVDDMTTRASEKGNRALKGRESRERGGAQEPGGKDHVQVLAAIDSAGEILFKTFPTMNTGAVRYALSHALQPGVTLVSDAAKCFSSAARKMGVRHIKLNISAGQRKRGIFHIQTVNNVHGAVRVFLAQYNGIATKYLDNYLEWFRLLRVTKPSTPLDLLTTIFAGIHV